MEHSADVVVIGAGAAGIMAAWRAACLGAKVVLLEKTERIGTKILISGGGKCNLCHDGPIEEVLRAFRPNEARFIRPACYRFPNTAIVEMFTSRGLEVYTRPDNRIFPVHQTAKDVVQILRQYLDESGVEIRFRSAVRSIGARDGRVVGVETADGTLNCPNVVLCTGGSSYPNSGTTGDGWKWAQDLGHQIVKVRAALAPIYMDLSFSEVLEPGQAAGVALRDIVLKARQGGKEVARWRGDLLFTHRGISGPTVLGISRVVAERMEAGAISIEVDVTPDESFEELSARITGWQNANPRKLVPSFLEVIPDRLRPTVLAEAGIGEITVAGNLAQKSRNRLVETLKGWRLGEVRTVPLEKGECVAGGVSLDEVDPQTMRSKVCEGLFLAGEVLDVAGPVGGYNLQAAFATGYVAGETAARQARQSA